MSLVTADPERIPVQVRTTLGARGGTEETVHCPARSRTVRVDECLECHASDGFVEEGGRQFVRCRRLATVPVVRAAPETLESTRVWQVMTGDVICVRDDLDARELAGLLVQEAIHGVPVVDAVGKAVGVVSQADLVKRLKIPDGLARLDGGSRSARERELIQAHASELEGLRVEDLMSRHAAVISEDAPVVEAASMMASRGLHRLPVVGSEGEVVGILTAFDLIRWLADHVPPAAQPFA